jgi:hypothetical protein
MKNLNILTKGLLLCAIISVIGTGCTPQQKSAVNEEPFSNEMLPSDKEQGLSQEQQTAGTEEKTAVTGEEKTMQPEEKQPEAEKKASTP